MSGHVHIVGVCGTFMAGVARLARALGHTVTGSDRAAYPPMSEQLAAAGIEVWPGYEAAHLDRCGADLDLVIIGNAVSRGNPLVEAVLDRGLPYTSGPQWLAERVLQGRWVLAVAGTHGKTTTSSLVAWLLESAGLAPGFLIGGVPQNFGVSARLGEGPFFVIEADEYDTAFFDKRSKFLHYRPRTLVLNNLEFDHADIFPDLAAIQTQFRHLLRTVPGSGRIIANGADAALAEVLAGGVFTPVETFAEAGRGADWEVAAAGPGRIALAHGDWQGEGDWPWPGAHNRWNAAAAVAAAAHAGVEPARALAALAGFAGVRRRLEVVGHAAGVTVYDDFAHHPTAVAATLAALRERIGPARLLCALERRSNSMRMGVHDGALATVLAGADAAWLCGGAPLPGVGWAADPEALREALREVLRPGDHVVLMSNGDFDGLPRRLLAELAAAEGGA
ncbi:MAG: UDP-N-acetylmuramate--L-alanyl-gamma-D-glutamyl-meso-2,6-diaminoheptandioate ligase [Gammaproteobacteria bacterium]|nr:MAG: UDP-N-acetylmuramate--L-alanyl-gamma-D-glutamyl-meso-2,6-diaminoheptandioate ligase [Gammaproteobacteria bacterium]